MSTEDNAILLTHGEVYSGRGRINVIWFTPDNRDGNNVWTPKRGPIVDEVRECVRQTATEIVKPGWMHSYPEWDIAIRTDYTERGKYHYSIYSKGE